MDEEWTTVTYKKKRTNKKKSIPKPKEIIRSFYDSPVTVLHRRNPLPSEKRKKGPAVKRFRPAGRDTKNMSKIAEETEDFSHKKLTHLFKLSLMKARINKNLTQEKLANLINVKKNIIISYESGSAIPDSNIVNKLQQVLGVKLPKSIKR